MLISECLWWILWIRERCWWDEKSFWVRNICLALNLTINSFIIISKPQLTILMNWYEWMQIVDSNVIKASSIFCYFKKYLNLTSSPWASKSSTNTHNNSLPNPTLSSISKHRTMPSNHLSYLRLWNELSIAILSFLFNPQIKGKVGFDFYTEFVKKFQKKIDPIKLLKIIK